MLLLLTGLKCRLLGASQTVAPTVEHFISIVTVQTTNGSMPTVAQNLYKPLKKN